MVSILSLLTLTDDQRCAVTAPDSAVVVTAGAGSGKTRALVGRYLRLLEAGLSPRSVVTITFTEKAAREMRTRIRDMIQRWLANGPQDIDRRRWEQVYAELDAAPIGTIHSLCARILRTHPAEAGVDPAFEVLDEGVSAAWRARAVESALVWAANDTEAAGLFSLLTENALRRSVSTLLENRLDASAAFEVLGLHPLVHWEAKIRAEIAAFLDHPAVYSAVADLESLRAGGTLARLAGDRLAATINVFFDAWDAVGLAWSAGDLGTVLARLPEARRALQPRLGRKSDWPDIDIPRDAMTALRECYDAMLADLLADSPDWSLDERASAGVRPLRWVAEKAEDAYRQAKARRRALDYDDLEAGAVTLLENHSEVRAYWRAEVDAVLVDEFQDTNDRQRRIVYALTGFQDERGTTEDQRARDSSSVVDRSSGRLFIVGDAKQSIYRFRGADVTVFREVQRDVKQAGGRTIDLDLTFRAHASLLCQINGLLEPIMGRDEDTERAYIVPFVPLRAHRSKPRRDVQAPFVEFCLGLGDTAADGRAAAASALARRLHELHDEEGIAWGDIGLLFRASTSFPAYEDAFEQAGIPFVTVAGRGFYDRPEVRDLLNALRAIADPTDDCAMAGLLRSPAFGLSDAAIYRLRRGDDGAKRSLWTMLHRDLSWLSDEDRSRAERARRIVTALNAMVGRTTVAHVLKHFLDLTHYRAILRFPINRGGAATTSERARRNVDKLLADAHASRLVSVGEFLEYLQTLRDVAAREGEAPVEAGDAVQLMTVHKAKGLEFPVVVIADASHSGGGRTRPFLLDPELGPVWKLRGDDGGRSIMYRLATLRDRDQEEAEERRLLYVAATRARERLLISGHVKASTSKKHPGKLLPQGWLKQLGEVVGLGQACVEAPIDTPVVVELPALGGYPIRCTISPQMPAHRRPPPTDGHARQHTTAESGEIEFPPRLLRPVLEEPAEEVDETVRVREADPPRRVWRVVPTVERPRGPAWVVGTLVHEALRRWCFPGEESFDESLRPRSMEAGLTDEVEIKETLDVVRRLLSRFQTHWLYGEMTTAQRYHEVPYSIEQDGQVKSGQIDVLYQHVGRWYVVDFKTDEIRTEGSLPPDDLARYERQVRGYVAAVRRLLNVEAEGRLCFLNAAGQVKVVPVAPEMS